MQGDALAFGQEAAPRCARVRRLQGPGRGDGGPFFLAGFFALLGVAPASKRVEDPSLPSGAARQALLRSLAERRVGTRSHAANLFYLAGFFALQVIAAASKWGEAPSLASLRVGTRALVASFDWGIGKFFLVD